MWTWLKWLSMHTHIWLQILWPCLSFSFSFLTSAVLLRICLQWEKNINEPLFAAQKQHDLWGKCSWAHLTILLPFWEIWSKLHILAEPYFSQLKRVYDITGHSRWLFSFSAGPAPASPTPDSQDFLLDPGPSFWLFWPLDQNLFAYQRDNEGLAPLLGFPGNRWANWMSISPITGNLPLFLGVKTITMSYPLSPLGPCFRYI